MPPRLTIGAVGGEGEFSRALARAGHRVRPLSLDAPEDVTNVDLLLLDADDAQWLGEGVDTLAPYVRPRQMVIHTALLEGTQLLDAAETRGAVVMAAHNIFGAHWVTSAADELGETVIGLLIAEIGGTNHPIADTARPVIAAAVQLTAMERTVRWDSFELLRTAVEDADAFEEDYLAARPGTAPAAGPADMERMHRAIAELGTSRLFADIARRHAERTGDAEVELWALSKADKNCR